LNHKTFAFPPGGHPDAGANPEGLAKFTESYAFIPANTMRDIVTSFLPGWTNHRAWILARPLSGFAETFAQYALELAPGGGSDTPEPDPEAQAALFVAHGNVRLTIGTDTHELVPGSFAYLPPSAPWSLWNTRDVPAGIHWIRKRYDDAGADRPPKPIVVHTDDVDVAPMPDCDGKWSTQRFIDPVDLAHDFHINMVSFLPGGRIPFAETHVMEHGLYVLEGTGKYLLNADWVDVGPGDFMWLRAFCPQACIATGDGPFRYLLYKDVNRHVPLGGTLK